MLSFSAQDGSNVRQTFALFMPAATWSFHNYSASNIFFAPNI